ncbi:spore germination protein [Paenibacillus ginsengarvi]|uniref:Spore germination protein n=1 Tax=Paenibacillus ginsengarvi TaxID=400777 RepID=A0A3B0CKT9_9BACL|nr:spore germination protein [Paenibacillus ginsengarvi]RKN84646.1 spore germination protein [Paenibacillus ginsengarvi]
MSTDTDKKSPEKQMKRPKKIDDLKIDARELLTDEEMGLTDEHGIPRNLEEVKQTLQEKVGLDTSFDLVFREMEFATKKTAFFYANGFAKDTVLTDIITRLSYLQRDQIVPDTLTDFMEKYVAHIQVQKIDEFEKAVHFMLIGATVLFIEGEESALGIDAKMYPVRSIEEPDLERVVRGARDGFVETLLTNVTLIRRRIRDPKLKLELMTVGIRSRTDVCIGYIGDIADPKLVESLRDKVGKVKIDGIPLGDKQLEEAIIGKGWNPYPTVRYSERPDVVAAHLLEGHVIIFADTSPSVMILPTTFFHLVQHVEEYRQTPIVGSYLRWVRFIGIFASLFLLPLWFLMVSNPELKPPGLDFLGPQKTGELPLLIQFLLVEIGVDLMRLAAVHTPSPLTVAMGLVAAILVGDIAVKTGLFINEVIMYMAFAAVGMFATPSYELGLANRLVRLLLLVLVAVFKIPGLVIGITAWIIYLSINRTYNTPYMWPFLPFNFKAFMAILVRRPVLSQTTRPSITNAIDKSRQPAE